MYWCCDVCDIVLYEENRNNHLESRFHKRLAYSFIKKYIFLIQIKLIKESEND